MLMGAFRKVDMALDIYVYALLTAPSLVFAPIFFAIFGLEPIQLTILGDHRPVLHLDHHREHGGGHPVGADRPDRDGPRLLRAERQLFFKIILPRPRCP